MPQQRRRCVVMVLLALVFAVPACGGDEASPDTGPDDDATGDDDADDDDSDDDAGNLTADARAALERAVQFLLDAQADDGYWEGSFETDTSFTADYILLTHYVGRVNEARQEKAVRYILDHQNADGGWSAYPGGPSVDYVSVLDYLALKLAGLDADDPAMSAARAFILAGGGAETANRLVQTRLALFGQVPWNRMIPFNTNFMLVEEWLYRVGYYHSVLIPFLVIYESGHAVIPPPGRDIAEIFLSDPFDGEPNDPPPVGCCREQAIDWILERQEEDGNWAGVFINTMYSMIALSSTGDTAYDDAIDRGMEGVESFQTEDQDTINQQFSQPPVMDTAYVLHVLLASDVPSDDPAIARAVDWLVSKQTTVVGDWVHNNPEGEPGGWSFEHFNQYYPDVDCTVMVLDAFALLDADARALVSESMSKGLAWALSMQNDDGGWAAWDKNAIDPAAIFAFLADEVWVPEDLSWADLTARTVLALASLDAIGFADRGEALTRGIEFLRAKQEPSGAWWGRWGTNYTYATGQVLQALVAAGISPDDEAVVRGAHWLRMKQNGDGGFGETPESYIDPTLAGEGPSTIFQTAYAVIGLMAATPYDDPDIDRAIAYLIDEQRDDGSWYDEEFLGTNLPAYWYARYDMLSTYKAAYALATYLKRN